MSTPTNVNPEATQVGLTGSNTGNEYLIDPDTGQPYDASHPLPVSATITPASAVVSTLNSTTTLLTANAVYTGTSESSLAYGSISVEAFADQASAASGLVVQQSQDGTNWDIQNSYSVVASTAFQQTINLVAQFFRVKYTNGAVNQGVFRLQTIREAGSANQRVNAQSGDFVDGAIATVGAQADTSATTDTGTFSLMALVKRLITKLTTIAGAIGTTGAAVPASAVYIAGIGVAGNLVGMAVDAGGKLLVVETTAQGYVAAYGSNLAATVANTDYLFKWGGGGVTPVNRLMVQNNTAANVQWDLDVAATLGSPILGPGQTIFFNSTCSILHLLTAAIQNVNGSTSGNIVVRGWN